MLKYDIDRIKYPIVYDNKLGITDLDTLLEIEGELSTIRYTTMFNKTIAGSFDLKHLCAIHKCMFQDVYPWAGQIRDVDISKGNTLFCLAKNIEFYAQEVFGTIKSFDKKAKHSVDEISKHLARISDDINALHPFREGNGRSKRAFLCLYAKELGYFLDLSSLDDKEIIRVEISTFTSGNINGLAALLKKALTPIKG